MAISVKTLNIGDHVTALLNWCVGFVGTLALMAGLAFLPSLFGKEVGTQGVLELYEIVLSTNILGYFNQGWGIGILVVATVLFTWVCLILSMSTHSMVVAFVHDISFGGRDAEHAAWGIVLFLNLVLVALFVFILFGGLFKLINLLIWSLLMLAVGVLLIANYSESHD